VRAVDDVSLVSAADERWAGGRIGIGKSVTAMSVIRLISPRRLLRGSPCTAPTSAAASSHGTARTRDAPGARWPDFNDLQEPMIRSIRSSPSRTDRRSIRLHQHVAGRSAAAAIEMLYKVRIPEPSEELPTIRISFLGMRQRP